MDDPRVGMAACQRRPIAVRALYASQLARGAGVLGNERRVRRDVARKPMDPAEAAHGDGVVVEKRERKRARAFGHVGDFYGKRADGMPVQLVRFGGVLAEAIGQQPVVEPDEYAHGRSPFARNQRLAPWYRRREGRSPPLVIV